MLIHKPSLIAIALLMLPFVQIGYSYYFSVQIVLFLLVVVLIDKRVLRKTEFLYVLILYCTLYFSVLSFILDAHTSGQFLQVILRISREYLCVLVFVGTVLGLSAESKKYVFGNKEVSILSLTSVLILILAIVQIFYIGKKVWVGLPREYYVLNASTLPTALDLIYSRIRPSATFGEPSYLSFYCCSVLVCIYGFGVKRSTILPIMASIVTIFLSQSLSGVFFCVLLTGSYYLSVSRKKSTIQIGVLLLFALVIYLAVDGTQLSRFINIFDNSFVDQSVSFRLLEPLALVVDVLRSFPFGIPFEFVLESGGTLKGITSNGPDRIDNAILGLIVNYGFIAIFVLIHICVSLFRLDRSGLLLIYFGACCFFNGTIFQYGKISIVCLSVILFVVGRRFSGNQEI